MGCPVSRRESNLRETRCSPAVASKALQFTMRFLKAKYNIVTIVTIAISPDKSYIVILTAFPQVANEASRTALNRLAARLGLDTQWSQDHATHLFVLVYFSLSLVSLFRGEKSHLETCSTHLPYFAIVVWWSHQKSTLIVSELSGRVSAKASAEDTSTFHKSLRLSLRLTSMLCWMVYICVHSFWRL